MLHYLSEIGARLILALCLSLGLATNAAGQGAESSSTQFQDWSVKCAEDAESLVAEQKRCVLVQVLRAEGRTEALLRIELSRTQSGEVSGFMIVPFGLDLSKGVSLSIDGGERWNLPFRTCQNFGCVVRLALSGEIVERMQEGGKLNVTLYTLQDSGTLDIPVSLAGFTAALEAL